MLIMFVARRRVAVLGGLVRNRLLPSSRKLPPVRADNLDKLVIVGSANTIVTSDEDNFGPRLDIDQILT
jgi:hypothetical protein